MNTIDALAHVTLGSKAASTLGTGRVHLRRAWPRRTAHLLLEFESDDGRRVAGQWFGADDGSSGRDRLEIVAAATRRAGCGPGVVAISALGLLLQADGADRRLPQVRRLLASPEHDLVSHCPELRAVVRQRATDRQAYIRIVRPETSSGLLRAAMVARSWSDVATPQLLEADEARGVSVWSVLPGVPLSELWSDDGAVPAAREAGRMIRRIHDHTTVTDLSPHGAAHELGVLARHIARLEPYDPERAARIADAVSHVDRVTGGPTTATVVVHRDLHDRRLLVDRSGSVGVLGLETLALGEAALDLGNLLAHLQLRALQGRVGDIAPIAEALLDGYEPDGAVLRRLPFYLATARLRLVADHAFSPRWREETALLLDPADELAVA